MLGGLLKRLFGGGEKAPAVAASEDYNGYRIEAIPRREDQGWRVAGRIAREVDGTVKSHEFIRADLYPGKDDAVGVCLQKGRKLVDERGDRLFD